MLMSRRRTTLLAFLAVALLGAAAASAAEPVEIKFLGRGDIVLQNMFTRIITQFEAAHPDIRVNLQMSPGSYADKLTSLVIGGQAPDVVFAAMGDFRDVVEKGFFEPLDPFIAKDPGIDLDAYFPAAIESGRYKGKLWMWPYDGGSYALMYNRDLFDAAGLSYPDASWSWNDQVETASRKMTQEQNGKITQLGMADMAYYWWYMAWVMGGDIVTPDGLTSTLSSRPVSQAVNWLLKMKNELGVMPSKLHAAQASGWFPDGQVGMVFDGRWGVIQYRQAKFPWDVSVLPVGPDGRRVNVAFYSGFSMVNGTKHPKEAWEFIKFVGGPVGQKLLSEYGEAVPALINLATSPAFFDSKPPQNNVAFLKGMEAARSWPTLYIPNFGGEYSSLVYPEIDKIMAGKAAIAQILTPEFDQRVTAVLQRGLAAKPEE